jgi:DNA-binding IclR family transcriptional regulator
MSSPAPALDRGLRIVAALAAQPQGLGFNDIATRFGLSKSVCSRLLSVLIAHHFVIKAAHDGRYYLDQHAPVRGMRQLLEDCDAAEVLPVLAEDSSCTALLVVQDGDGLRTIAKQTTSGSPHMRAIGSIRYTWLTYPWAWCVLMDRPQSVIAQLIRREKPDERVLAEFATAQRDIARQGWCWQRREGVVRMACPLRDRQGLVAGAIALGGQEALLDRATRGRLGALLKTIAGDIERRIGAR